MLSCRTQICDASWCILIKKRRAHPHPHLCIDMCDGSRAYSSAMVSLDTIARDSSITIAKLYDDIVQALQGEMALAVALVVMVMVLGMAMAMAMVMVAEKVMATEMAVVMMMELIVMMVVGSGDSKNRYIVKFVENDSSLAEVR